MPDGVPPEVEVPLRWLVSGRLLDITLIGWFHLAFTIVATPFLNRAAFSRRLYAVGDSPTVAKLSGVSTGRTVVGA